MKALQNTHFSFPKQTQFYKGKVRDVYTINNDLLVMIASDRISAFDVVLPEGIPFKGQILNQISYSFLQQTKDILPNWTLSMPDPQVTIGKRCEPFKVEMVIRGYLSGHAAREHAAHKTHICGVPLPKNMNENDKFTSPIITPTTKASIGHDEDISREQILTQGIVNEADYTMLEKYTYALFQRGTELAAKQGLILVDTKYEFGKIDNIIYLMDEIHTPDSSRYFYADGYHELQKKGKPQRQLSKEFVRQWLIANDFMGKDGQIIPAMNTEKVNEIADRYIELYEKILGEKFVKADTTDIQERIESNVLQALQNLGI